MTTAPQTGPQFHVDAKDFFTHPRTSRAERRDQGADVRSSVPLESLGQGPVLEDRRDPLEILHAQDAVREQSLVPLRYERMAADPFAFLRGSAAVMASDLSRLPTSGLNVQLCGDAHVSNFGMFASAEQTLLFDVNDFDETLAGPFDWDVRRLVASAAVAARGKGLSDRKARRAAKAAAGTYRRALISLSDMPTLDVWNLKIGAERLVSDMSGSALRKAVKAAISKSRKSTSDTAAMKLTETVDGQRRFRSEPPLLARVDDDKRDAVIAFAATAYENYLTTLSPDRIALLARYSFVDLAHKVVGVGSVGTRAVVMLLESGDGEPLILQLKQAGPSVLEEHLGASRFENHGKRIVVGQRVMQASGDPFLGWLHGEAEGEHDYYVRQLRNNKSAVDVALLDASMLVDYSAVCGATLARAHARAGDASTLAGYLGDDTTFDDAMADFAIAYADVTAHDHAALVASLR